MKHHIIIKTYQQLVNDLNIPDWLDFINNKSVVSGDRQPQQFLSRKFPRRIWKRGTHLPVGRWLNTSLRELADHYLSPGTLNREGLFEMAAVNEMLRAHRERQVDNTFKLWNLIIFSAWKEHFRITTKPT